VDKALNRVLAVPNWSFFDPGLCEVARGILAAEQVQIHYCRGDVDHQRTVIAFSGDQEEVFHSMDALVGKLLPMIDLQVQNGVHPRVGSLDVAPFILLAGSEYELIAKVKTWAALFSDQFGIPIRFYEKAAEPGNEQRLPYLRGQKGKVVQPPDFGAKGSAKWGTTITGVRDFLLATNLNLATSDLSIAKKIARTIRERRDSGDKGFEGVRALGFALVSRKLVQVSLNFTEPDLTTFDDLYSFVKTAADQLEVAIAEAELIGVIRQRDLPGATLLTVEPSQVVH
jgi:glutamate formiminotransferase / 5-formyltetrahydrofolate cyclo-ligase